MRRSLFSHQEAALLLLMDFVALTFAWTLWAWVGFTVVAIAYLATSGGMFVPGLYARHLR